MRFKSLKGNFINIPLNKYAIDWDGASLSKFQWNCKQFFRKHFSHLAWYEEVPLCGMDVLRFRFDFLAVWNENGVKKLAALESQGVAHVRWNPKFHKTLADFEDQQDRDEMKRIYCEENRFELLELFEDDMPIDINKWLKIYPNALPLK